MTGVQTCALPICENRRKVEALSQGRRVLNAFSFTGGFSLYAARGGATSVLSLDLSQHSLAGAKHNFALNPELVQVGHQTVQADVFRWLQEPQDTFGLIVLDPPSLARRESERAAAIAAYGTLAEDAVKLLSRGGILVSASCSAHVSEREFYAAVRGAVQRSGRGSVELETTGHAADHHATFAEAEYLKAIFIQVF